MTAQLVLASPLVLLFAPGFPLPHAVLQVLQIQILVSGHDAPRNASHVAGVAPTRRSKLRPWYAWPEINPFQKDKPPASFMITTHNVGDGAVWPLGQLDPCNTVNVVAVQWRLTAQFCTKWTWSRTCGQESRSQVGLRKRYGDMLLLTQAKR